MGILTFKGGVHPYDGKELSKNSPAVKYLPKGDMVYPLSQHIGAPAKPLVAKGDKVKVGTLLAEGRPCARRTEDRRCCGVCLITDPFVCFRYGKRNRTAPDSNRFYGQFHYH